MNTYEIHYSHSKLVDACITVEAKSMREAVQKAEKSREKYDENYRIVKIERRAI